MFRPYVLDIIKLSLNLQATILMWGYGGVGGDEISSLYEGNSISKLQIQVATYVFELSAGNCHR